MPLSFWKWFLQGRNRKAGWKKFINWWLLLHISIGFLGSVLLPSPLKESANTVLLPLAGVFIGMSFAWVGNIQTLLLSQESEKLYAIHAGGFENYAYTFQSAILVILITLVLWGMGGMGMLDRECLWDCPAATYDITKGVLFFFASLAVRECWHVVVGAQLLLIAKRYIGKIDSSKESEQKDINVNQ